MPSRATYRRMWTHKLTVIGGQTQEGDYTVLRAGQAVGRILPTPFIAHSQGWEWATLTLPSDNGRADSQQDALDALRAAVRARWPDSPVKLPMAGHPRVEAFKP